jgi:hypothetical protein
MGIKVLTKSGAVHHKQQVTTGVDNQGTLIVYNGDVAVASYPKGEWLRWVDDDAEIDDPGPMVG